MAKPKSAMKKNRMTIYLPESVLWRMREVAVSKRITGDTNAIEAAVREWIGETGEVERPAEEQQPEHPKDPPKRKRA